MTAPTQSQARPRLTPTRHSPKPAEGLHFLHRRDFGAWTGERWMDPQLSLRAGFEASKADAGDTDAPILQLHPQAPLKSGAVRAARTRPPQSLTAFCEEPHPALLRAGGRASELPSSRTPAVKRTIFGVVEARTLQARVGGNKGGEEISVQM